MAFSRLQLKTSKISQTGIGRAQMKISTTLTAILAIVFGILVLTIPELLRWLVGVFFIVAGIFMLVRK